MYKKLGMLLTAAAMFVGVATIGGPVQAQVQPYDLSYKVGSKPSERVNPCLDRNGVVRVASSAECGAWVWTKVTINYQNATPQYYSRTKCPDRTYKCYAVASRDPSKAWFGVNHPVAIPSGVCSRAWIKVDYVNQTTGMLVADSAFVTIIDGKTC